VASFGRCYLGRGQARARWMFLPRPWSSLPRVMQPCMEKLVQLSEWPPAGFTGSCCRGSWPKPRSGETEFSPEAELDFGRGGDPSPEGDTMLIRVHITSGVV
jgi:hypothetical protein